MTPRIPIIELKGYPDAAIVLATDSDGLVSIWNYASPDGVPGINHTIRSEWVMAFNDAHDRQPAESLEAITEWLFSNGYIKSGPRGAVAVTEERT